MVDVVQQDQRASRWTLRLDGIFLCLAGSVAMFAETVGHFFGVGPLAATRGSPHTIGGFEAHGLAVVIAVLLLRGATQADRKIWHVVGLVTHLFLGASNVLYWGSFVHHSLVQVGVVSTILHIILVIAHAALLARSRA
jgi:hypothetical protein